MYDESVRKLAAELQAAGHSIKHIAEELGIPYATVHRWIKPAAAADNLAKNNARRLQARAVRFENDPKYREWVAEQDRLRDPVYRKEKQALQRDQQRQHLNKLETRCHNKLLSSINVAAKNGYAPCNATVGELVAAFNGRCHYCGEPEANFSRRLGIEHCHETGAFRGWSCNRCNTVLGYKGDDPEQLREYLRNAPRVSKLRGVTWDPAKKKWRATIQANGTVHQLGRFATEEAAALAYDAAARLHHGAGAKLNFPDSVNQSNRAA